MRTMIWCGVTALLALAPATSEANQPATCICFGQKEETRAPSRGRIALRKRRAKTGKDSADPEAERRARLVKILVSTEGTADETDLQLALDNLIYVPTDDLAALVSQGTKIVVVRDGITEWDGAAHLEGKHPPGYPEDKTFEDVKGVYFGPPTDVIVVATQGHDTGKPVMPRQGWTILHEIGHALDQSFHTSEATGARDPAFVAARDAEFDDLSEYQQQEGARGYHESFAESYARRIGNDEGYFEELEEIGAFWDSDPLAPDEAFENMESGQRLLRYPPVLRFDHEPESADVTYRIYVEDPSGQPRIVADSSETPFASNVDRHYFHTWNLSLQPNQMVRWRVAAVDSDGSVTFSPWNLFGTSSAYNEQPPSSHGLPLPSSGPRATGPRPVVLNDSVERRSEPDDEPPSLPTPRSRRGIAGHVR